MPLSPITRLTVRWLNSADDATAKAAAGELIELLHARSNSQDQIEYWLSYAGEMTAGPGEPLAQVIETEWALAKMQGLVA